MNDMSTDPFRRTAEQDAKAVEMLERLTDFIKGEGKWEGKKTINPRELDMDTWGTKIGILQKIYRRVNCGTIGCMAYHMSKDDVFKDKGLSLDPVTFTPIYEGYGCYDALSKFMSITYGDASFLFGPNNDWDERSGSVCKTPKDFLKRIEYLQGIYAKQSLSRVERQG